MGGGPPGNGRVESVAEIIRTAEAAVEKNNALRNFVRTKGNVIIFLAVWLAGMLFVDNFADWNNIKNIIAQSSAPIIACLGMTFVLMTGGIDLSVGFNVGLCSYMLGFFAVSMQIPTFLSILLTVALGGVCGFVNGVLVQTVKIPAFIVTLGMGYILLGVAQIVSNGSAISNLPQSLLNVARFEVFTVSMAVYIALAVVALCYFFMHHTTYGRSLEALGLNPETSALSGVHVAWIRVSVYVISGMCAALASIILAARVNNCVPTLGGNMFTFQAITAAILGGASLFGGEGTAWGSVLGVLTIFSIQNILGLLGVNYYMYTAILSLIILTAIILENVKNRVMQ
jgi:ribose/xylose/arabinose/galactoside ABC-type transport system permease subunit